MRAAITDGKSRGKRPLLDAGEGEQAEAASVDAATTAGTAEIEAEVHRRATATASLNDAFRQSFAGGRVLVTRGVTAMPEADRQALMAKVQAPLEFEPGNDPYGEHDFGVIEQGGVLFFWNIDAYDIDFAEASSDPSNPDATGRVLTIMQADEY